jgi:hypothetical protein
MKAYLFTILILWISMISCHKTVEPQNEEELITSLIFVLTPISGGESVTYSFVDKDGIGGNPPVITTTGILKKNGTYAGNITLKNESKNPVVDINPEISDEALDHQFFFIVEQSLADKLIIEYNDSDSKGNPVGLKTTLTTKATGVGKLSIILRHKPNKDGLNVKNGNIANAGGETDIEVSFDISID